jgi:hypothetical protein
MGFSVASLGLLGLSLAYILFVEVLRVDDAFQVVAAFGLGKSLMQLEACRLTLQKAAGGRALLGQQRTRPGSRKRSSAFADARSPFDRLQGRTEMSPLASNREIYLLEYVPMLCAYYCPRVFPLISLRCLSGRCELI